MDWIAIRNIAIYVIVINLLGFFIMFLDKKRAKTDSRRIPENTLLYITLMGGSIGTIAGMYTFRHKTKKPRFYIGFPVILAIQIILIIYMIVK